MIVPSYWRVPFTVKLPRVVKIVPCKLFPSTVPLKFILIICSEPEGFEISSDHEILLPSKIAPSTTLIESPAIVIVPSAVIAQTDDCIPNSVSTMIFQSPTLTDSMSQAPKNKKIVITGNIFKMFLILTI